MSATERSTNGRHGNGQVRERAVFHAPRVGGFGDTARKMAEIALLGTPRLLGTPSNKQLRVDLTGEARVLATTSVCRHSSRLAY